jgi:hypothetical protein
MRRLFVPFAVVALLAALAIPAAWAASSARTSKVITVLPTTILHLAGTKIYCSVNKNSTVACFHLKSQRRDGYAIVASDKFVAVEPTGSTKPVFLRLLKSLKVLPVFSGGHPGGNLPLEMNKGDVAAVGKTHVSVLASTAKGGGLAMGVVYLDGRNLPISGTYAIGISDHFVTVVKVVGPQKTQVVYRHAVR